jgi:hypothetical protein
MKVAGIAGKTSTSISLVNDLALINSFLVLAMKSFKAFFPAFCLPIESAIF